MKGNCFIGNVKIGEWKNLRIADPDCEYFCTDCFQLRLSFLPETIKCKNCGSKAIIKAKPGYLDQKQLKRQYQFLNLLDKT